MFCSANIQYDKLREVFPIKRMVQTKMKRFLQFFAAALVVVVLAMAVVTVNAAEADRRVDPTTLEPTSDRVIFIKDAPEGGSLTGDGSGHDADNPFIPSDHEQFDPTADYPQNHLQTAFYQATEMLMDDGGTIVICGPIHLGMKESYGSGASTKDVFTAKWGSKKCIKFTSVYNGIDYRETAGAKITLENPALITVLGSSIWDDITIETIGSERVISFSSHPTLVGPGVKTYPADEAFAEVASNYLSLAGGHRYAKGTDQIPTLTVQSGTYNKITGGLWGVVTNGGMENATSYLTLEGTTKVLGFISGTVGKNSTYGGHVNITINGGTYECDIFGCGSTGMTNTDGTVDVVITGGDFSKTWSVAGISPTMQNNAPASTLLDLSGFKGDKASLASLFAVSVDFDTVRLPEGVTEAELVDLAGKQTEAPSTTSPAVETTKAPETDKPKETAKETQKSEVDNDEKENNTPVAPAENNSMMTLLIVVIIVAVVIVGGMGAVIIVLLTKNKKK